MSRPENVTLAREALAGLADTISLSREQFDDIRTAVTEACNNVVQHAYSDGPGPMDMEIRVLDDAVEVLVRDEGVGIGRAAALNGFGEFEIGLPVILALAERLELGHPPDGGTEVQMRFRVPGVEAMGGRRERRSEFAPSITLPGFQPLARLAFSSAELAGAILPRVACALATRAHMSADRVSDVALICDALAAHGLDHANGSHLEVALAVDSRTLALQVGPLLRGGAQRIIVQSRLPAVMGDKRLSPLEQLVDRRTTTAIGPDDLLVIELSDRA